MSGLNGECCLSCSLEDKKRVCYASFHGALNLGRSQGVRSTGKQTLVLTPWVSNTSLSAWHTRSPCTQLWSYPFTARIPYAKRLRKRDQCTAKTSVRKEDQGGLPPPSHLISAYPASVALRVVGRCGGPLFSLNPESPASPQPSLPTPHTRSSPRTRHSNDHPEASTSTSPINYNPNSSPPPIHLTLPFFLTTSPQIDSRS